MKSPERFSLAKIHKRNARVVRLKASGMPEVGIWFYFKGNVIALSTPWKEGHRFLDLVCGKFDHYDTWKSIQEISPDANGIEYSEIPHGRVVYNVAKRIYFSYGSEAYVNDSKLRNMVADEFRLPIKRTKHVQDDQYEK